MSYIYIRSEPNLWTVGFYNPSGEFQSESDHSNTNAAAARVSYLNGNPVAPEVEVDPLNIMSDRAQVAEKMLEHYCVLRTNCRIQEAICKNLWEKHGPASGISLNAHARLKEAREQLDAQKYEILELMGVDS